MQATTEAGIIVAPLPDKDLGNVKNELIGGEIIHLPDRPGEPKSTHADITKIQKQIGWEPKITIKENIDKKYHNKPPGPRADGLPRGRMHAKLLSLIHI